MFLTRSLYENYLMGNPLIHKTQDEREISPTREQSQSDSTGSTISNDLMLALNRKRYTDRQISWSVQGFLMGLETGYIL